MQRVMLRVSYDGTEYSGWQLQPNATTVEGVLNAAISDLTGEDIQVTGASRTDAGVHSLGNVCIFDTESPIPAEKISYALNTRLPEDVRVIESKAVTADFHPRHVDSVKTYEYKIWNDIFPNPVLGRFSHFSYRKIDVEKMREAAKALVGEHDFGAFVSSGSQAETTVRTIYGVDILVDKMPEYAAPGGEENYGRMIRIRVSGSGFLYNMVRIIAGTLLEIGTGLRDVESIDKALESRDRSDAGPTAPACGLTMIGIKYSEEN